MSKSYATPAAFRAALEDRLRRRADESGRPVNALRDKIVMERLLARVFADDEPTPWLLKGGYAMELRFRPHARTTRDLDFSVPAADGHVPPLTEIRDVLQRAAERDLGDFLVFRVAAPSAELAGAPDGGGRFPVEALIAGKAYARFAVDVGIGDALAGTPEDLEGDRLLDFAGVVPARVRAIGREQQFAEKVHAYTFPWTDRANTRTKDLVDMLLLVAAGFRGVDTLRSSIRAVFDRRGTHAIPSHLPPPPASWTQPFALLAAETELRFTDCREAFAALEAFWNTSELGESRT